MHFGRGVLALDLSGYAFSTQMCFGNWMGILYTHVLFNWMAALCNAFWYILVGTVCMLIWACMFECVAYCIGSWV